MTHFTIRPAVETDLDALWLMVCRAVEKMNAEGSEQWSSDYPTPEHYREDIRRGELLTAVADDGSVLGIACATTAPEPNYRDVPWNVEGPALVIHRMAVDPELQRSGVASALFEYAENRARQQGVPAVHVDTYSKNEKMQALFRGRGFVQRGTIRLHGRPLPYPAFEKLL